MLPRAHLALLLTTALGTFASAQTNPGDIALTGFSTTTFGIYGGTAPATGYPTSGFGGLSQTILWDDQAPTSFLIGGGGFIGRATVLGPGSVNYTVLTANVNNVAQMSWDAQHQVVFADFGTAQLHRLDPTTGVVTPITSGMQPWGTDLTAAALDPLTQDIVCGGNGGLFRVPAGAATGLPFVSGLGGFVSGIQFDPQNGDVLATVLTVNRVIRVTAAGVISDVCPPFAVPGPNALDLDQNGELIAGGGTGQVYRIPRSGGAPVFLLNNTQPFGNVNGIAVVGGGGYGRAFGSACNASFGPAMLGASGPFLARSTVTLTSSNHQAGAAGVLVLGLSRDAYLGIPLPFSLDSALGTVGCSLNVSADVTFAGVAAGAGPANLVFQILLPASFQNQQFFAQHATLEAVPGGFAFSNGIAFRIR
ncbi:MAG: hypothetical protein MUC36_24820 [Planctomycetes bacterium]|jgi:hypothetical protein|nr:hypothetical protein [Planctomycetota bacterium]